MVMDGQSLKASHPSLSCGDPEKGDAMRSRENFRSVRLQLCVKYPSSSWQNVWAPAPVIPNFTTPASIGVSFHLTLNNYVKLMSFGVRDALPSTVPAPTLTPQPAWEVKAGLKEVKGNIQGLKGLT